MIPNVQLNRQSQAKLLASHSCNQQSKFSIGNIDHLLPPQQINKHKNYDINSSNKHTKTHNLNKLMRRNNVLLFDEFSFQEETCNITFTISVTFVTKVGSAIEWRGPTFATDRTVSSAIVSPLAFSKAS